MYLVTGQTVNAIQWTNAEVGEWATKKGFSEYKKTFAKKLDGLALLLLTSADLQELGVEVWFSLVFVVIHYIFYLKFSSLRNTQKFSRKSAVCKLM